MRNIEETSAVDVLELFPSNTVVNIYSTNNSMDWGPEFTGTCTDAIAWLNEEEFEYGWGRESYIEATGTNEITIYCESYYRD